MTRSWPNSSERPSVTVKPPPKPPARRCPRRAGRRVGSARMAIAHARRGAPPPCPSRRAGRGRPRSCPPSSAQRRARQRIRRSARGWRARIATAASTSAWRCRSIVGRAARRSTPNSRAAAGRQCARSGRGAVHSACSSLLAIAARVAARMAAVAIGLALEQRRPVAAAGAADGRRGRAVDGLDVHAVDDDAGDAVGGGALGDVGDAHGRARCASKRRRGCSRRRRRPARLAPRPG